MKKKTFGGKKLTKVSPNKTYSGAFGSLVLSLLSLPILIFIQKNFLNEILINFLQINFFIFTLLTSLVAQMGDITVSYWKRIFKINRKIKTKINPSILSRTPPCPGNILPVSLILNFLFQYDTIISPICAISETNGVKI